MRAGVEVLIDHDGNRWVDCDRCQRCGLKGCEWAAGISKQHRSSEYQGPDE